MIVGCDTVKQLEENIAIATAFRPLPATEMARLEQLTAGYVAEASWFKRDAAGFARYYAERSQRLAGCNMETNVGRRIDENFQQFADRHVVVTEQTDVERPARFPAYILRVASGQQAFLAQQPAACRGEPGKVEIFDQR